MAGAEALCRDRSHHIGRTTLAGITVSGNGCIFKERMFQIRGIRDLEIVDDVGYRDEKCK